MMEMMENQIEQQNEMVENKVDLTERQSRAEHLIESADIPDEMKTMFTSIISLRGQDSTLEVQASQIIELSDELNDAKRHYLEMNDMDSDLRANQLIQDIIRLYSEIQKNT